jgi:dipeptidyl aminopeptidase/acylaminoacyl peptidase
MLLLLLTLSLLTINTINVMAQDDPGLVFAAVQDGQPTVFGLGDAPLVIDTASNSGAFSLTWSPDGNLLAYIKNDENFQSHVYVADVTTGATPIMLNTGALISGSPITFSNDGQLIYIGQVEDVPDTEPPFMAEVKRIVPTADAQPETLGSFEFGIGCGGGASIPAFWKYWEEAGFGGSGVILKMTDFGLLHSTNCSGLGLALLNLETGEDTPIGPGVDYDPTSPDGPLGRAALSPDGQTLAALESHFVEDEPTRPFAFSLVMVDLATLAITDVTTTAEPDQVAWSKDGTTLFYSAQENPVNLAANLTTEQMAVLEPIVGSAPGVPLNVPAYTATIHQFNPATGEDTLIYSADAFAIGHMAAAPDGQHLIASQVAGLQAWTDAVVNGTISPTSDPDGSQQSALVPVTLYRIPFVTREAPIVVGENLTQFTLRPTG